MLLSGTWRVSSALFHIEPLWFDNTMSLDIGGTSADVAFIRGGLPHYGIGEVVGSICSSVAVTSIGAGGGSIAWVDDLGVLRVGPGAGSTPGPACYNRGGSRPTTTDAFAVLGYIGQFEIGYSAIEVDIDKARNAIESVAKMVSLSIEETAQAIIDIAVSGMYMEVSKLVSRYAIDPRDFVMQAFGGAGPMMACFLAKELGLQRVIIPATPGVLSALGGLIADIKNDFISTVFLDVDDSQVTKIQSRFKELKKSALTWLKEDQGYSDEFTLIYSADMRYRGQSFEIETLLNVDDIEAGNLSSLEEAFHVQHEKIYEHCDREAPIQIVNLRLVIAGTSPKPHFVEQSLSPKQAEPINKIEVFVSGKKQSVNLYQREQLGAGAFFKGPAVVAQNDTTTCIPDGISGEVDTHGNLVLSIDKTQA